ncbi:hypothetical protein MBLNU230_g3397t1 [Neophaeotheca triangularis]
MSSAPLDSLQRLANKKTVLATYRALLRATRIAFEGDKPTLLASRQQAHDQFRQNSTLQPGSSEAEEGVQHAHGVTQILLQNLVQGKRIGDEGERYKLNIHEHTERGDNETATTLKGTRKSWKEVKNSSLL